MQGRRRSNPRGRPRTLPLQRRHRRGPEVVRIRRGGVRVIIVSVVKAFFPRVPTTVRAAHTVTEGGTTVKIQGEAGKDSFHCFLSCTSGYRIQGYKVRGARIHFTAFYSGYMIQGYKVRIGRAHFTAFYPILVAIGYKVGRINFIIL